MGAASLPTIGPTSSNRFNFPRSGCTHSTSCRLRRRRVISRAFDVRPEKAAQSLAYDRREGPLIVARIRSVGMPEHMALTKTDAERGMERKQRGAVIHLLGRAILAGDYKPGDILPGEIPYSAKLGVSRSGFREAIQGLIAKGLVESRRRVGTRVLPRNRWSVLDRDVLAWAFAGDGDAELLQHLVELRAANEPFAAGLAAHRRDKADLRILKEAFNDISRYTSSTGPGRAAVQKFHETVLSASGNDALISLGPAIMVVIEWGLRLERRSHVLPQDPAPYYKRIYDSIASSEPSLASEAMTKLLALGYCQIRLV